VDGVLIIDVGDIVDHAKILLEAETRDEIEWALRLIYCHARDKYDVHHWGYFPSYLWQILKENGFKKVWIRKNFIKHVYPSFQICVKK
jgi:hypothetical protein